MFNFRHVMERAGVPMTNKNNWAIGHALQSFMRKEGVEPSRILAPKTDPNPKVAAPHCIAHYPISYIDAAVEYVREIWDNRPDGSSQMQLF